MTQYGVDQAVNPAAEPSSASLHFFDLTYLAENDEVTVGRVDTGTFIVMPIESAELLRRLEAGMPGEAAAAWYESTYDEPVDVADFIDALRELDFIDNRPSLQSRTVQQPLRWSRLARWIFSPVGLLTYLVLIGLAITRMVQAPRLIPAYHNLLYTHYVSVVVISMFIAQTPLVLLHEAAHALAARRLGLPSKLRIGRRYYFVVFETNLDSLVSAPRRKRYLPILAGLLTDLGVIAALTLIVAPWQRSDGSFPVFAGFLLALAYTSSLRAIWQFWFFLQTDLYYLIVTVLGCVDLQTVARQRLKNVRRRLVGRTPQFDPAQWHPKDAAASRWYCVAMVLGYGFFTVTLFGNVLPAAYRVFHTAFANLSGKNSSTVHIVDTSIFLLVISSELGIAAILAYRERSRRSAARTA